MGSGEGGHRLAMAFETEAGFQFVGHELEVGRLLERNELLEEGNGFGRPQSGQWSPPESLAAKWERSLRKRVRSR